MGIPEYVARTRSGSPAVARWSLAERSKSQCSHRARGWLGRRSGQWAPPKDTGTRNFPRFDATRCVSAEPMAVSQVARSTPASAPAPGLRTPRIAHSPQTPAHRRRGPAAARIRDVRMATAERREARPPPPTSSRPAGPESRRHARGGDAGPATQEREPTWTPWLIPEDAATETRPE